MVSYISEPRSQKPNQIIPFEEQEQQLLELETQQQEQEQTYQTGPYLLEEDEEEEILWRPNPRRKEEKRAPQVCLEGYVEASDEDDLPRTKSLTDDDLDELKGCLDLGFGFSYDEIPELCNTLPALELCYSMSQKFLDDHPNQQQQQLFSNNGKGVGSGSGSGSDTASFSGSESSSPVPTWKISSPGDHPEDVKARLKFWAQAVACTVKLCS